MPFLTIALLFFLVAAAPLFAQQADSSPAVWTTFNIGNPLLGGSSRSVPCQPITCPAIAIETSAAGLGAIDDGMDEFTFTFKALLDDGAVIARVEAANAAAPAEAGVSVRNGLAPYDGAVSLVVSPTGELLLHTRSVQGGPNQSRTLGQATGAIWLKLERRGMQVSAFRSEDGSQWTAVGQETLPLPTEAVYVGVVAASRNPDTMLTSTATNLHTEQLSSLAAGWSTLEVGGSGSSSGSWSGAGTHVTVNASGAIGNISDRFAFTYLRVTGDAEIAARIVSAGAAGASEAGVMVRESLDLDAANLFAGIAAPNTRLTKRRVGPGLPATVGPSRTVSPGWWLKLVRRGTLVETFESPDGVNWTEVSSEALVLPDTFLLGLAFAAGPGVAAQGVFDNVSVRGLVANKPPEVKINTPAANSILAAGTTVAVSASAADPDDRVTAVEFYVDGTRVGSDTAVPYQATWTGAREGSRVLTAIAIDSEGARTTSLPVTVTVSATTAAGPVPGSTPTDPSSAGSNTTPTPTIPDISIPPVIPEPPPVIPDTITPFLGRAQVQFTPSADHDSSVDRYVLQVFTPDLVSLVVTRDLGRPAVSDGTCTAEITDLVAALAPGSYVFSLRAVDDTTHLSSAAITTTFTR